MPAIRKKYFAHSLLSCAFLLTTTYCSVKEKDNSSGITATDDATGSSDKTTTDDDTTNKTTDTSSNLANAFPGSLALTVFPQDVSVYKLNAEEVYDPSAQSIKAKVEEAKVILDGKAESCMPSALSKAFNKENDEQCYEFDQDMIYGTGDSSQQTVRWLGTKDGKNSKGEACLAAFTRNQVSQVVAMVDQTLGFGMSALCQAKKKDAAVVLPEVGKTIDLKAALEELFGSKATVTAAELERLESYTDSDGILRNLYRISMVIQMERDSITRKIGIIHSPKDDENKEYSGTIYTELNGEIGGGQVTQQQGGKKHRFMSIVYAKKSETDGSSHLKAELRTAQVAESLVASAITSEGVLDFNVGAKFTGTKGQQGYGDYADFQQANEAVDGITYIAFDLNSDTSEGTLSYWKNPGGNYYENARGFNILIAKNDEGVLAGCATSGAASTDFGQGVSIRRFLNEGGDLQLKPQGFWHPFMNSPTSNSSDGDGSYYIRNQQSGQVTKWYEPLLSSTATAHKFATDSSGSLITRQCFKQNKTSGLYEVDTSEISETAGYEILDTGSTVNAAKFIAPPDLKEAKPIEGEQIKKSE